MSALDDSRSAAIAGHYGDDGLAERLRDALRTAGYDLAALTPEDLKTVDQFHIGGRQTTRELASLADIRPGTRVLDVGGGIGGPARTLASEFGCAVTVLDLTASYIRAGDMLTARTGLSDRVSFRHGNALAMPFADDSFDLVWTQHSSMNVPDKPRLYAEIARVLRRGGRLALHEVLAGPEQPVHFPVPWASEPAISFLISPRVARALLRELGFREAAWNDVTSEAEAMFRAMLERTASTPPNALDLRALMGERFPEMSRNLLRNLHERRVNVIQAVFDRP